ncbi:MAG: cbb3-type cytochrome oxidase assembly protein CcoS [Zoogloeaceae bacterium]|jgi:phosphomannomutase/phosphoglucomutase|nr:cbb3-type cytochrome oxidase assembly protein CcoS [Zoogloeaceae bacterium]
MESLYLLIPFSVVLVFAIAVIFWRSVRGGQFDDLEGPGFRILMDDDLPRQRTEDREQETVQNAAAKPPEVNPPDEPFMLPAEIFKAYDIRGIVGKTLTPAIARQIGQALGSLAREKNQRAIAVGRDGRLSGAELADALMEGICAAGVDAIDIGCVPTPVTYFAAYELDCHSCVSVTGSHNPPDYNGLKMVIGGETLALAAIQNLKTRAESGHLSQGKGTRRQADVLPAYLNRVVGDVKLARPLKIVMDCGNGVAGKVAPELFKRLGCEITPLFCEVDGHFPNHHPDPSKPENLADVIKALATGDAEIGIAFDGDGDRLGVVSKDGEIIYPDRQLMLFAADVLSRVPNGEIIYDVKCTRLLDPWIREHGGKPLMWNTGHALVKAKLKATGAPLAGEMSGHVFFRERWYGFDDGLYAGARLLEILSRSPDANPILRALPKAVSTPELNIRMQEGEPALLVEKLKRDGQFTDERTRVTIDGLRVEYADGFGLARSSNTTPVVVLRFEADDAAALNRIQEDFRQALTSVWAGVALPF